MNAQPIIDDYTDSLLGKSSATIAKYRSVATHFLASLPTDLPLEGITPQHVRGWVRGMQDDPQVGDSTIRLSIASLRSFLNWLAGTDTITREIPDSLPRRWKCPRPQAVIATDEEVAKLAAATADKPDRRHVRLAVLLAAHAGLRRAEIASLKWADVEFFSDPPTISVVGKGNKRRTLPIFTQALYDALRDWKDVQEAKCDDSAFVFPRRTGEEIPISANTVGLWFGIACHMAGIRHLGPHALRHAFAHGSHRRGVSVAHVSAALGHSALQTTAKYLTDMDGVQDLGDAFAGRVG